MSGNHVRKLKLYSTASDLSKLNRKRLWSHWFGHHERHPCPLCQEGLLDSKMAGFQAAHIIPRCKLGNNTAVWNRIPTCPRCNCTNGEMHMLDYIYENCPSALPRIALKLQKLFKKQDSHLYALPLGSFVFQQYQHESFRHGRSIQNYLDSRVGKIMPRRNKRRKCRR